jgi:hypothetical protein
MTDDKSRFKLYKISEHAVRRHGQNEKKTKRVQRFTKQNRENGKDNTFFFAQICI